MKSYLASSSESNLVGVEIASDLGLSLFPCLLSVLATLEVATD